MHRPGQRVRAESGADGEASVAVVVEGGGYCDAPSAKSAPKCLHKVAYQYSACRHLRQNVPCDQAFIWAACEKNKGNADGVDYSEAGDRAPPCSHPVEVQSPLCKHVLKVGVLQPWSCYSVESWLGWEWKCIAMML